MLLALRWRSSFAPRQSEGNTGCECVSTRADEREGQQRGRENERKNERENERERESERPW